MLIDLNFYYPLFSWINAILAVGLAVFNFWFVLNGKVRATYRWIKLAQGIAGIYWAGFFSALSMGRLGEWHSPEVVGYLIFPALTLTIAAMLTGAVYRFRYYQKLYR